MDSTDNVILFSRPGLGIIQHRSCRLKSHMAHARCVKFLEVRQWGTPGFNHSMTQEFGMSTQSFRMNLLSMICTLLVFIQSQTSSGNTLFAMSIAFGSLMNRISCSWVYLKTYCAGCSNTWRLEMSRINVTIDAHQYQDILPSCASLNHSIRWNATPGRGNTSGEWSEQWQWIGLRFLTAPRMTGKPRWKQPLMKW